MLQKFLPKFCVQLSQQYHLSRNGEALMYNDSRKDLHRLCQIPRICQCKLLLVSWSAPRTSASSFVFLVKFWFSKAIYTDNSLEFGKDIEELSSDHRTSTPRRSETNCIGERVVRRIRKELLQHCCNPAWTKSGMLLFSWKH